MSKPGFLQDSDDDDIWDYQPRQRFPGASHQKQSSQLKKPSGSQKQKPGRKRNCLSSQTHTVNSKYENTLTENTEAAEVNDRLTRLNQGQKSSRQSQCGKPSKVKTEIVDNQDTVKHRKTEDKVSKKSKTNTRKRLKTPKVKVEVGNEGKETEKREGFCPNCQMPYAALSIVQSPTWHVHECLETPYSSKKECPKGLSCDSTIASHYKKFHHRQLARHRARLKCAELPSPGVTETKRKIEFDQHSGKENIPDNTAIVDPTPANQHDTPDAAEVLSDSNRDVDQMLMDALGDNDNSNSIPYEHNPASQVIQSESSNSNSVYFKVNENTTCTGTQGSQGRKSICAIDITESDTENRSTETMETETNLTKGIKNGEMASPQRSCLNTENQKESCSKPSFFELSQSAQKLGFFAKKKRQRNQRSSSVVKEEIPLKKAKKGLEKLDENSKNTKCRAKRSLDNITNVDETGDKNNNCTNDASKDKVDDVHVHQEAVEANDGNAVDRVRIKEEKLSGSTSEDKPDSEGSSQNELHIKIGDIRSEATDIFYGSSGFTGIIDKPSVIDANSATDNASSDTESSRPDISDSESEEGYTEMDMDEIHSVSMDENPDLIEASLRLGGGGFIIESQVEKHASENNNRDGYTADADITSKTEGHKFDSSSEPENENQESKDSMKEDKSKTSTSTENGALVNERVTPKAEKPSDSKSSPLMNAFSILMQKGKSLSNKLLNRRSSTQTSRNAMDILMSNSSKQHSQPEVKPKREWSLVQGAADEEAAYSGSGTDQGAKRTCPFYKKIPGTPFTVDAFRYGNIPGCKAYFLTHFHYDHYGGLTKKFSNPIYCTQITCNLVKTKIKTDSRYLHPLPLNTPTVIEGTEVTFLDANHCPGSVLILFKLRNGKVYLHTGDFRAHPRMEVYPCLVDLHVHSLYLDTTYCDPQYTFPPQEDVISCGVQLALDARTANPKTLVVYCDSQYTFPPQEDVISCGVQLALDARTANPKTLIVCGSYTIGKERIFTAIAEALNCKICVMRDKKTVLDCLDDPKLSSKVSLRWEDSGLHVLPMGKLNYKGLDEHLRAQGDRFDCVLALEPTGWACNKKFTTLAELKPKLKRDRITLYGVPYSEHSSYLEMKRFVQFIQPDKILPTVNNGNVHSRKKMEVIFEKWNSELKQRT